MKLFSLFVCSLLLCLNARAQKADSNYSFSIRICPQYLLINGFRADFEKSFKHTLGVYIAGQYYSGLTNKSGGRNSRLPNIDQSNDDMRNNDQLDGYGLNAGARVYLNRLSRLVDHDEELIFFTGADVMYQKINVQFNDYDYYPFYQNGLQYYSYDIFEKHETIEQKGINSFLGFQKREGRYHFEVLLGMAYRDATIPPDLEKFRNYKRHSWDYGYSQFGAYCLMSFGMFLF
ncbi:MAG: hypothetical protein Q8M15_04555 [Bacteroidota bacterium]|nr:hypothetical protein [Bacteroidota bacterium]